MTEGQVDLGGPKGWEEVINGLEHFLDRKKMTPSQKGVLWGKYLRAVRQFPQSEDEALGALEGLIYARAEDMTSHELGGLAAAYYGLVGKDEERWKNFLTGLQTNPGLDEEKIRVVWGMTKLSQG